jgi:uncharacterized protein YjbI with pentapeptide repeats
MNPARFRNCKFTNTLFNKLKLKRKSNPKASEKEGYQSTIVDLNFPIIEDDPNNAYSSICTGYSEPIKGITFNYYDEDLHVKFRQYIDNGCFDNAVVYDDEIYLVNFNDCTFINTNLDVDMFKVEFRDTILENITTYGEFENCNLNNVKFVNSVINNTFRECKLKNVNF